MKTRKLLSLVCGLGLSVFSFGQTYLGVHSSNYGGIMSTDFQPASFVDGRFKVDVQLVSFDLNLYQNAFYFDAKNARANGMKWWWKGFKQDENSLNEPIGYVPGGSNPKNDWAYPDSTFSDNYIKRMFTPNSTKTLGFYNSTQIDILNFAFHVKPNISIGLKAKIRSHTNVENVNPQLVYLAENNFDIPTLWNTQLSETFLNVNHMTWAEIGFNYAQILMDKEEHFLKMGGTVKWLEGLTSVYFNTENLSYNLINSDTTQFLEADLAYGYSSNLDGLGNGSTSNLLGSKGSKWGLGLDLGLVYEWRPNWKEYKYDMDGKNDLWRRSKEKYKLRAGLSILDIGGISFHKGQTTSDFSVSTSQLFDLNTFAGVGSLSEFDKEVDSLTATNPDWTDKSDGKTTYFMSTPTTVGLSLDYHIWKIFYINATGQINVVPKSADHAVRRPSQVSITPSIDYSWVGAHFPVSYNKYSGFKAGVGLRLGPLTVGVTDFRTLFAAGKVRGAEMYAGLRIPILYTEPIDSDNDKVSDKLDQCIDVPGVWDFRGCPDTDGDGIMDKDDECPQTPGPKELKGCPDTDGDGIADKDDECPKVPGIAKFKGCPDTDGDGIQDSKDDCPELAGPVASNGCPDTDGDGIFDNKDKCPTEPGVAEKDGCPYLDADGDGLIDEKDDCPNIAGPIENKGCPYQDQDGDGVLDKDDKCPTVAGVVENDGCPKIEEEVQEILQTAFENLEFETGKDIIKQVSIPSLTKLAEVLIKKPEWKLQISGHTDAVGSAQSNLLLSKKRSEAVKKFMIDKGISADRLTALYFGETQPIATNDTKEGRQKNRRVEMQIVFE